MSWPKIAQQAGIIPATVTDPTKAAALAATIGSRFGQVVLAPCYTGAFTVRGLYAAGTTYSLNDIVATDGGAVCGGVYRSKVAGNVGNAPATSPTQWELLTDDWPRRDAVKTACKAGGYRLIHGAGLWTCQSSTYVESDDFEPEFEPGCSFIQSLQTNGGTSAMFRMTSTTVGASILVNAPNVVGAKTVTIATPLPAGTTLVAIMTASTYRGGIYRVVSHTGATPDVLTLDRPVVWQFAADSTCQPLSRQPSNATLKGNGARLYGVGQGFVQCEYAYNCWFEDFICDASSLTAPGGVVLNLDTGSRHIGFRRCTIDGGATPTAVNGFGYQGCEDWTLEDCDSTRLQTNAIHVVDCQPGQIVRSNGRNSWAGINVSSTLGTAPGSVDVKCEECEFSGNTAGVNAVIADKTVLHNCNIHSNTYNVLLNTGSTNTEITGGTVARDLSKITAYPGVTGTKVDGCPIYREMACPTVNDYLLSAASANKPGLTAAAGTIVLIYRQVLYSAAFTENLLSCTDAASGWFVNHQDGAANYSIDIFGGVGPGITTQPYVTPPGRIMLGDICMRVVTMGAGVGAAKYYGNGLEGTAGNTTNLVEPATPKLSLGQGNPALLAANATANHRLIGFATSTASLTIAQVVALNRLLRESGPEAALLGMSGYAGALGYLMADHAAGVCAPRFGTGPNLADAGSPTFAWRKYLAGDALHA